MITRTVVFIGALTLVTTAQAALHDRGGGLIYDDVLNITWLQDANYAKTSGYWQQDPNFAITVGYHADGLMTWAEATTWAATLSIYVAVNNVTYDDWRLPTVRPVNGQSFNFNQSNDGSTDYGFNITSPSSELAYMFYVNLGNVGYYTTDGALSGCYVDPNNTCLDNVGPFTNLHSDRSYWSDTSYTPNPGDKLNFTMGWGRQQPVLDVNYQYAWAVRDGDVAAIPEPETYGMFLAGLGLLAFKLRER